jgi:hypothetical protein
MIEYGTRRRMEQDGGWKIRKMEQDGGWNKMEDGTRWWMEQDKDGTR